MKKGKRRITNKAKIYLNFKKLITILIVSMNLP